MLGNVLFGQRQKQLYKKMCIWKRKTGESEKLTQFSHNTKDEETEKTKNEIVKEKLSLYLIESLFFRYYNSLD